MTIHIFNVSGDKPELLRQTLTLALAFETSKGAAGWYVSPEEGIVLCWGPPSNCPAYSAFPAPLTAEFLAPMVAAWLDSPQAKATAMPEEDQGYPDGDGDNELGWRVHASKDFYAICAVKPSYCYYGK